MTCSETEHIAAWKAHLVYIWIWGNAEVILV